MNVEMVATRLCHSACVGQQWSEQRTPCCSHPGSLSLLESIAFSLPRRSHHTALAPHAPLLPHVPVVTARPVWLLVQRSPVGESRRPLSPPSRCRAEKGAVRHGSNGSRGAPSWRARHTPNAWRRDVGH